VLHLQTQCSKIAIMGHLTLIMTYKNIIYKPIQQ